MRMLMIILLLAGSSYGMENNPSTPPATVDEASLGLSSSRLVGHRWLTQSRSIPKSESDQSDDGIIIHESPEPSPLNVRQSAVDRDRDTIHVFLRMDRKKYLELQDILKSHLTTDEYTIGVIRPVTPGPEEQ